MKPVSKNKAGLSGYAPFLGAVKNRIRAAQVKATLAANAELIHLYWDIRVRFQQFLAKGRSGILSMKAVPRRPSNLL